MDARELDALIRAYRGRIDAAAERMEFVRKLVEKTRSPDRDLMERRLDRSRGALNRAVAWLEGARDLDDFGWRQTRDRLETALNDIVGDLAELERSSRELAA